MTNQKDVRRALKRLERVSTDGRLWRLTHSESDLTGLFAALRWRDGESCPYCSYRRLYRLSNGTSFHCRRCNKRFSVKVGTIFQGSKLSLQTWVHAIWCLTQERRPVSSTDLADILSVTQTTAWKMLQTLTRAAETPSFSRTPQPAPKSRKSDKLSPQVQAVLRELFMSLNSLEHPSSIQRTQRVMVKLAEDGYRLPARAVRNYFIEKGWGRTDANQIEAIARAAVKGERWKSS